MGFISFRQDRQIPTGFYWGHNMKNISIITLLLFATICYSSDVVIYSTAAPVSAPVAATGQTNAYAIEDDGALKKGVVWPNPRFTVQANTNCVTDNLTGLVWARNANQFGKTNWNNAVTNCNNLSYGGYDDWRLPNKMELKSVIDCGVNTPALPAGHPFASVAIDDSYWTSTTLSLSASYAWYFGLTHGISNYDVKTAKYYSWPVRGP